MQVSPSIRLGSTWRCKESWSAEAAWLRHFRRTTSKEDSISPTAPLLFKFAARARAARASGLAISPKATFGLMPAIGPDFTRRALLMALAAPLFGDTRQEIMDLLAALASALSESNGLAFLDRIDHAMPDYHQLESNILALTEQNEVSASVDILKQEGDDHSQWLEVDWFLQIRAREQ